MARERTTPNATQKRTCAISLEAKTRTYSAVKSEFESQPYYQAMIVAQGHLAQEPRPILVDNNDMFFVFYWALWMCFDEKPFPGWYAPIRTFNGEVLPQEGISGGRGVQLHLGMDQGRSPSATVG